MKRRVLLASLHHETNTFLKGRTTLSDCTILKGNELFQFRGDVSPLSGFLQVAEEKNWEVLPTIYLDAQPGPTVEDRVIEYFLQNFTDQAQSELERGVEAIYLVLHGAMVSESLPDIEGELLSKIRKLKGAENIPICGVIDLHANFSLKMAEYSQGLISYKKNPHTDAKQTAVEAALLLEKILDRRLNVQTVWKHPPVMWPPTGTGTSESPMLELEQMARSIEASNDDILSVNVLSGFAFADIPNAGVSFTANTIGPPKKAMRELEALSQLALQIKEKGNKIDTPIDSIIGQIKEESKGPILLVEPSDNIGGGSPGDCTGALQVLIENNIQNALCVINDPEAVHKLLKHKAKKPIKLKIGGKRCGFNPGPLDLEVELISTSNGRFTLEDQKSHMASASGKSIDMGPCAVVRHKGITILLTSKKTPPFDLGQLHSQGIIPEKKSVIIVKAAVAHRKVYEPIAYKSYTIDTPGPCSSDIRHLSYRRIKRPIYPLDEI